MSACQAGRRADFGGRWMTPCPAIIVRHSLHTEGPYPPLEFCDKHMNELIAAGLIDNVDVDEAEIERLKTFWRGR